MTISECTEAFEQQIMIRPSMIVGHDPHHTKDARKMAPAQGKWRLAQDDVVRAEGLEPSAHGLSTMFCEQTRG
jgi:hypothetical protein